MAILKNMYMDRLTAFLIPLNGMIFAKHTGEAVRKKQHEKYEGGS
jgi:hypothetical protein